MSTFQHQFDYLFNAIAEKYPEVALHNGIKQFQFTGSPLAADWTNSMDIRAYNMANAVSASVDGFYTPNPGSLYASYTSLILSIDPIGYSIPNKEYLKILSLINTEEKLLQQAIKERDIAWNSYKLDHINIKTGLPYKTKFEWLTEKDGGLQYQVALNQLYIRKKKLAMALAKFMPSMNKELAIAQANLTSLSNQSRYIKLDGSSIRLPSITLQGDLSVDLQEWRSYSSTKYDLDIIIDKETVIHNLWKTLLVSKKRDEALVTSKGVKVDMSSILSSSSYSLRIRIKGFKGYDISFGNWYDARFVNPNTAKFSPAANVNTQTFFGRRSGSLHMIPTKIWVIYQPSIELKLPTLAYKKALKQDIHAIDWLNYFTFRFSTLTGKPIVNVDGENVTMNLDTPVLQSPQVFGVTSLIKVRTI